MVSYLKVLHVEDNDLDAQIYRAKLEANIYCRFEIKRAATLSQARTILKDRSNFDIILLDLNLPDSKGLDTLEGVLDLSLLIPVTVLSGTIDEGVFKKALGMGATSFLIKKPDIDVADHLIKVVKKVKGMR